MQISLIIIAFGQYTPDPNFDYPFNDIVLHNNTDPNTCQKYCDADIACIAYVIDFDQVILPCWLKSKLEGKTPHSKYTTFRKTIAPATADKLPTPVSKIMPTPTANKSIPTPVIHKTETAVPESPLIPSIFPNPLSSESPHENNVKPVSGPSVLPDSIPTISSKPEEHRPTPKYVDNTSTLNTSSAKSTENTSTKASYTLSILISVASTIAFLVIAVLFYRINKKTEKEKKANEKSNYEQQDWIPSNSVKSLSENGPCSTIYNLDSYHPNRSPYKWNSYRTTDCLSNSSDTSINLDTISDRESNASLYSTDYEIKNAALLSKSTNSKSAKSRTSLQETCFSSSEYKLSVYSPWG